MGSALALALLAAVEPLGVVAYIAVLGSNGGRRNTRAFLVGWVLCATLVAAVTALFTGGSSSHSSSTVTASAVLQIVAGVVVLALLAVRRRRGPRAQKPARWLEKVEEIGPVTSAVVAASLQGWPVVAAAAGAVLHSVHSTAGQVAGIVLVIAVSSSTYATAQVVSGRFPDQTAQRLSALRSWIETHQQRMVDLVLLLVGGWLLVHGVVSTLAA